MKENLTDLVGMEVSRISSGVGKVFAEKYGQGTELTRQKWVRMGMNKVDMSQPAESNPELMTHLMSLKDKYGEQQVAKWARDNYARDHGG